MKKAKKYLFAAAAGGFVLVCAAVLSTSSSTLTLVTNVPAQVTVTIYTAHGGASVSTSALTRHVSSRSTRRLLWKFASERGIAIVGRAF
jgi:hypothetical protein